jgi:uncharacterized protein (DUF1778 family)
MVRTILRTKSITTKLTEEEYARLETLAAASGQNMSEWVRDALLEQAQTSDEILLAEVLGLRTILLNLLFAIAKGEPMTAEQMQELIQQADGKKAERARKLLASADAGKGKESEVQA